MTGVMGRVFLLDQMLLVLPNHRPINRKVPLPAGLALS